MNSFTELGSDGQVLEWETHFLSDIMREQGFESLLMEPKLHSPEDFIEARLSFEKEDAGGVQWVWGESWSRVEVSLYGTEDEQPLRHRRRGESSLLEWRHLPFCEAVELTPYDANSKAGVTVRFERPLTITGEAIDFYVDLNTVVVRLVNYSRSADVCVELHTLTMNKELKPKGQPEFFRQRQQIELRIPEGLFGYVVVTRRRNRRRYLLDYRSYRGGDSGPLLKRDDEDERERIRREIEGSSPENVAQPRTSLNGWLTHWPQRSRKRLEDLWRESVRLIRTQDSEITQTIQTTPAGLFRSIVLRHCGFASPLSSEQSIRELNEGKFEEALARLSPTLVTVLETIRAPQEKMWAIRHAGEPRLAEVVRWAEHQGVAVLDCALKLVEIRAEASRVAGTLRADSSEGQAIAELLDSIEKAPHRGARPEELLGRLDEIKRRIVTDEQRSIQPEQAAPVSKTRHREWLEQRQRMSLWRRSLAQVIGHCENGEWGLPEDMPEPLTLELRLRNIKAIDFTPLHKQATGQEQKVQQHIKKLIADRADEPRVSLRDFACQQLQQVVLPHASLWSQLHEEIRRAQQLASEFGWLAEKTGVTTARGGLDERVQAAQQFLLTLEAAESFARGWKVESRGLKQNAHNRALFVKILTRPDHPWLEETYLRCRQLYQSLSPTELVRHMTLPEQLPALPSLQALAGWWEQLRLLDRNLYKLEWAELRFNNLVDDFKSSRMTRLE